jgi:protein SCO1
MTTRRTALAGFGALSVGLLAGNSPEAVARLAAPRAAPRRTPLPNHFVYTHEGKKVRFYDDLIKGRLVTINMMYAECEGICPASTANLQYVQKALGERVGRDIFMYSITLDPEHDTPEVLSEYVQERGIKRGWQFLTGKRDELNLIRRSLGFFDPDPAVDATRSQHTGMLTIGNDRYGRWHMTPALGNPEPILEAILHADRARRS